MKALSKQEEIELLTKLAEGGGYFADQFKHDLGRMICNVKNDFPIIHDTSYENKIHDLNKRIETQKRILQEQSAVILESAANEKLKFIEKVLHRANEENGLETLVINEIGLDATIKAKHDLKMELSKEQIDYLITKI
jgi:hypothetical protein